MSDELIVQVSERNCDEFKDSMAEKNIEVKIDPKYLTESVLETRKSESILIPLVVSIVGSGGISAIISATLSYLKRSPTKIKIKHPKTGFEVEIEGTDFTKAETQLKRLVKLFETETQSG